MNTKTILLTGATDGLGKATAFALAHQGHSLILHGRNPQKGEKLLQEIETETNNNNLYYYNADFAELAQINDLADRILANHTQLQVLINNAGLGVETARRKSKDGLEMIFQVDYLATYILSQRLLPLLEKSPQSHIINVASAGQAPIDFDDPMLEQNWSGVQAYCQAKLCQISLAFAMASQHSKVRINALHPASYMPTKIVTHMFTPQSQIQDGVDAVMKLVNDEGSFSGKYFFQTREERAATQAYDLEARTKLMRLSKQLTGV